MADLGSKVIQAIDTIVNSAIQSAGYDKTISATIAYKTNKPNEYKVKYQETIMLAYSRGETYKNNEEVYVLVPRNDFSAKKTILGSVEKLGKDYTNIISDSERYEYYGVDCLIDEIDDKKDFRRYGLTSYLDEDVLMLYDKDDIQHSLIRIDNKMPEYLTNADHLKLGFYIKTNFPENTNTGSYGMVIEYVTKDNVTKRHYVLREQSMTGNLYKLYDFAYQYDFFQLDKDFQEITKVFLYAKDFEQNVTKPAQAFYGRDNFNKVNSKDNGKDIQIWPSFSTEQNAWNSIVFFDVQCWCCRRLSDDELNSYKLYIDTPDGNMLDNTILQLLLKARIMKQGVDQTSDDFRYYWFKEQPNVYSTNRYAQYYNLNGGIGWKCLNTPILDSDQSIMKDGNGYTLFDTTKKKYFVKSAEARAYRNKYKCAVIIEDSCYTAETVVYNLNAEYRLSLYEANNNELSLAFDKDIDYNFVMQVEKRNQDKYEICESGFRIEWSFENSNNLTEVENDKRQFSYNSIAIIKGALKPPAAAYIPEKLKVNSSLIPSWIKISASVYEVTNTGEENYIGSETIRINRFEDYSTTPYSLTIENGTQSFIYDENGISPTIPQDETVGYFTDNAEYKTKKETKGGQIVSPLSFSLIDNTTSQIINKDENSDLVKNKTWYIPANKTLITFPLTQQNRVKYTLVHWDDNEKVWQECGNATYPNIGNNFPFDSTEFMNRYLALSREYYNKVDEYPESSEKWELKENVTDEVYFMQLEALEDEYKSLLGDQKDYYYRIKDTFVCNFGIAKKFNMQYQNHNQIIFECEYDNTFLRAQTNLTFDKIGGLGTNGTKYTLSIIPLNNNSRNVDINNETFSVLYRYGRKSNSLSNLRLQAIIQKSTGELIALDEQDTVTWEMLTYPDMFQKGKNGKKIETKTILRCTPNIEQMDQVDIGFIDNAEFLSDILKEMSKPTLEKPEIYYPINIVKVTIKLHKDKNNEDNVNDNEQILTTTYPIAIAEFNFNPIAVQDYPVMSFNNGAGFRSVRYNAEGLYPQYEHNDFSLIEKRNNNEDTQFIYHWSVVGNEYGINNNDMYYTYSANTFVQELTEKDAINEFSDRKKRLIYRGILWEHEAIPTTPTLILDKQDDGKTDNTGTQAINESSLDLLEMVQNNISTKLSVVINSTLQDALQIDADSFDLSNSIDISDKYAFTLVDIEDFELLNEQDTLLLKQNQYNSLQENEKIIPPKKGYRCKAAGYFIIDKSDCQLITIDNNSLCVLQNATNDQKTLDFTKYHPVTLRDLYNNNNREIINSIIYIYPNPPKNNNWVICGDVIKTQDGGVIVDSHNLTITSGEDNLSCKVAPSNSYSGICLNNAVVCQIYKQVNYVNQYYGLFYFPIMFFLNRYGQAAINSWDGNTIEVRPKGGIILSPQFGAGKKDENNLFTGMLMGKVKETDTPEKVGLMGYNEGVQSLFLDATDGSASFGIKGQGQIIFKADKVHQSMLLQGGEYKEGTEGQGMQIDLSKPTIKYGTGKFLVDEQGRLTCSDAKVNGTFKCKSERGANNYCNVEFSPDRMSINFKKIDKAKNINISTYINENGFRFGGCNATDGYIMYTATSGLTLHGDFSSLSVDENEKTGIKRTAITHFGSQNLFLYYNESKKVTGEDIDDSLRNDLAAIDQFGQKNDADRLSYKPVLNYGLDRELGFFFRVYGDVVVNTIEGTTVERDPTDKQNGYKLTSGIWYERNASTTYRLENNKTATTKGAIVIQGCINATIGKIGDWTIEPYYIYSRNKRMILYADGRMIGGNGKDDKYGDFITMDDDYRADFTRGGMIFKQAQVTTTKKNDNDKLNGTWGSGSNVKEWISQGKISICKEVDPDGDLYFAGLNSKGLLFGATGGSIPHETSDNKKLNSSKNNGAKRQSQNAENAAISDPRSTIFMRLRQQIQRLELEKNSETNTEEYKIKNADTGDNGKAIPILQPNVINQYISLSPEDQNKGELTFLEAIPLANIAAFDNDDKTTTDLYVIKDNSVTDKETKKTVYTYTLIDKNGETWTINSSTPIDDFRKANVEWINSKGEKKESSKTKSISSTNYIYEGTTIGARYIITPNIILAPFVPAETDDESKLDQLKQVDGTLLNGEQLYKNGNAILDSNSMEHPKFRFNQQPRKVLKTQHQDVVGAINELCGGGTSPVCMDYRRLNDDIHLIFVSYYEKDRQSKNSLVMRISEKFAEDGKIASGEVSRNGVKWNPDQFKARMNSLNTEQDIYLVFEQCSKGDFWKLLQEEEGKIYTILLKNSQVTKLAEITDLNKTNIILNGSW